MKPNEPIPMFKLCERVQISKGTLSEKGTVLAIHTYNPVLDTFLETAKYRVHMDSNGCDKVITCKESELSFIK